MGNIFESEIQRSANLLGLYYLKLSPPRGAGYFNTSPYDSLIIDNGRAIALELKSQKMWGSFPISNIAEHQLDGLQKMLDIGCAAYLLFNFRRKQSGAKTVNCNRAFGIHFSDWASMVCDLPTHNGKPRQSIPADMFLLPPFFEIGRVHTLKEEKKQLAWNLSCLLP